MTRYVPQWLQSGTYAASLDRRLVGALWPAPASSGCAVSAAGTGMDVHVDPGQVAVPSPNGTGSVLCTSDAIETVSLAPAPPAGTDRVDLIVCQPRSVDLDGVSNQEDFIFAVVAGAEGAPPGAPPAVPAGTVALAQVHVAGGSASLAAANITDRRPFGLAVAGAQALPPPLAAGAPLVSFTADGEVWVAKGGVYGGAWHRARDVIHGRWYRAAALTMPTTFGLIPLDAASWDLYALLSGGKVVAPIAGVYSVAASIGMAPNAANLVMTAGVYQNGQARAYTNNYSNAAGQFPTTKCSDSLLCAAGNTIELYGRCGAAVSLSAASAETYMTVDYLGTG